MNYRHAFHAGNFADVLKHAVLALVIEALKQKPTAFRVIDTHAGAGRYRLTAASAQRTGEWREGIGRLLPVGGVGRESVGAIPPAADGPAPLPEGARAALAPYLDAVRAVNAEGPITTYPGSPLIARMLLRRQDRLIVNEVLPDDHRALTRLFARDRQAKVLGIDGWLAAKSLLPPPERRGVMLIDPPFEQPGELIRLTDALTEALTRFSTGIYLLWHPIKDPAPVRRFQRAVEEAAPGRALMVELMVRRPRDPTNLNGCGLVVVNPPFGLADTLGALLPVLTDRLALEAGAGHRLIVPGEAGSAGRPPPRLSGPRQPGKGARHR